MAALGSAFAIQEWTRARTPKGLGTRGQNKLSLWELSEITSDSKAQTYRFRVHQDLRQHLHEVISLHGLDATHITEREGSPQTLVCTNTPKKYEKSYNQYLLDMNAIKKLIPLFLKASDITRELRERLITAVGVLINQGSVRGVE